ncbi:MAG: hypothetical protein ABR525_02500 [Candidatus Limnocylindria bacterium]
MLVDVEQELWRGQSAEILERRAPIEAEAVGPDLALVLAMAAKEEDHFGLADRLLLRALESDRTRGRATAHLAHLDYYRGDFHGGVRRAASVARSPDALVRAEAALYASVNLIALNQGDQALASALRARNLVMHIRPTQLRQHLRFRVARQLVHVYVAVGMYIEAGREAETAASIAARQEVPRMLAMASYLRGYVGASRGDRAALALFADADRRYGGRTHSFGRWVRYVWSTLLRDLGEFDLARGMRASSGIAIAWEDPLYELAETGRASAPAIRDVPADELPYRLATSGLIALVAGDQRSAIERLTSALEQFSPLGLAHYRRGCALALAVARDMHGERARARRAVEREIALVDRYRLARWPWWHPVVARNLAQLARRADGPEAFWEGQMAAAVEVAVPGREVLSAIGLTAREAQVVLTWVNNPTWSRPELAIYLGISEASVRNHLNRARRALHCDARRGPEPLRERIDELRYRPRRGLV